MKFSEREKLILDIVRMNPDDIIVSDIGRTGTILKTVKVFSLSQNLNLPANVKIKRAISPCLYSINNRPSCFYELMMADL